jgi:hypothetical protein
VVAVIIYADRCCSGQPHRKLAVRTLADVNLLAMNMRRNLGEIAHVVPPVAHGAIGE